MDPDLLSLHGGQNRAKYIPLLTLKFIGGLQTQRSELASIENRYASRFLGGKPDALIAGSNCEISNSLTLQRRPGLVAFGPAIPAPLAFWAFKQASPSNTQIIVDTPVAVYNYSSAASGLLFYKSPNAGQTNFAQSGNTLYFANGVDLYKQIGPNLLTQSNAFVKVLWTINNAQLQSGQFDPNGGLTATKITWWTYLPDYVQQIVTPNYTPVAGNTFTASAWLRAVSGSPTIRVSLVDQTGANVAFTTYTLNQTWTRYQVTGTASAGTTQIGIRVGTPSNTAIDVMIYGTQLEVGGPATPTQITTTQPQGIYLWGIVAPTAAPTVTSTAVGTRWQGTHAYLVGDTITDSNGNQEACTVAGTSGGSEPTWPTTKGTTTVDSGVTWVQSGPNGLTPKTGYQWLFAYLCESTGHPSNVSPFSVSTTALPNNLGAAYTLTGVGSLDPQVNKIAIYRNVDGGGFWFQVGTLPNPANGATWTFIDQTQDTALNTQIYAPVGLLNSPPPASAINPLWYQSRMWVSVGSVQFYSAGPDNASLLNILQNGVPAESFALANTVPLDEPIIRTLPTAAGPLIGTTGDLWLITGSDLASYFPVKILAGHGVRSYNAMDVDGSTLWLYTSDRQFLSINASAGSAEMGFPIGGTLAATFDPTKVYVARHVAGSLDNACFIADGSTGWHRVNPNQMGASMAGEPAPVWSPFATITGGVQAVASLETTPGVHQLLVGATGSGSVLSLGRAAGAGANDASAGTPWSNPSGVTFDLPTSVANAQLNIQSGGTAGSDVTGDGTGTGTAVTTGNITTGFNNELCFTVIAGKANVAGTCTVTPGGSWTLDYQNTLAILLDAGGHPPPPAAQSEAVVFGSMHQALAAAGAIAGTATLSRSETWDAVIATFKSGSGGAPTIVQQGSNFTTSDPTNGVFISQLSTTLTGTVKGNYLVVLAGCDSNTAGSITVNDGNGNTFSLVKAGTKGVIFLAPITTAGADTITITNTVNPNMLGMTVYEITLPAVAGSLNSKQLQATIFGLNVPNDNILGVKVYVTGNQTSSAADATVTLSWISPVGASPSYTFQLPAASGTVSFGGISSTWGQTLTAAVLNAAGFGFQIQANVASAPNVTFNVSAVKVQVFYLASALTTAAVLVRDLTVFSDNGTTYTWSATIGSLVLASPGSLAEVDSVSTILRASGGTQPAVAVLFDEISGAFQTVTTSVDDPPQLAASSSLLAKRYYLKQGSVPPLCQHMQIRLNGSAVATKDELLALTIRGELVPEQE